MNSRIFNSHTGAACGLIIGIILGALVLDHAALAHYLPFVSP